MPFRFLCCLSLGLATILTPTMTRAQVSPASSTTPIAFVHVNVVPMDRERVLHDQTVIVDGERITAVGSNVPVPATARIVDGGGTAYLSPGLADMHTHSETRNDLAVYLANGITTVLHMGGARAGFVDSTVPAANEGKLPSPHIYTSFLVDGTPEYNGFLVTTPEEARAIVELAKTNHYDFIKVYVGLSVPVFEALAEASREQGLPLVGHGVYAVRLERQLALGQALIAHAEEFFYSFYTPPGAEEQDTPPDVSRIPEAVSLAKKYGATVTADLATYHAIQAQIGHREFIVASLARPQSALLSPNDRLAWLRSYYPDKTARLADKYQFLRKLVKAFADAGVPLVAGTDAPAVPTMLPGDALHEDLAELESAGLSRFQALSTATREAGDFIHRTKGGVPFGTVTVGSRADLVLSQQNPLERLDTLREPQGVMADGRWYDADALRWMRDEVRDAYRTASAIPPLQPRDN